MTWWDGPQVSYFAVSMLRSNSNPKGVCKIRDLRLVVSDNAKMHWNGQSENVSRFKKRYPTLYVWNLLAEVVRTQGWLGYRIKIQVSENKGD